MATTVYLLTLWFLSGVAIGYWMGKNSDDGDRPSFMG